jgi:hypothetical protein
MSRRGTILLAVAIALAGGVGRVVAPMLRTPSLETRAMPGFSIALPDGKPARDERDYARGALFIRANFGDAVVGVAWQPSDGSAMTPAELEAMAQIFAGGVGPMPKEKATPTTVAAADGKPLGSIKLGDNMWMSMAPCGTRLIIMTTIASHGSEKLHRGVVRSLACAPDPAQEAALRNTGSALVLDLPGFVATERTPDQLQLSDGHAMILLQSVPSNIETGNLATVFGPIMKTQGMTATFEPVREGRVPFKMKMGNDTFVGWMRVFHCAPSSEAVMAIAETDAGAQSLHARMASARCRKPGEAAQAWPDSAKK